MIAWKATSDLVDERTIECDESMPITVIYTHGMAIEAIESLRLCRSTMHAW